LANVSKGICVIDLDDRRRFKVWKDTRSLAGKVRSLLNRKPTASAIQSQSPDLFEVTVELGVEAGAVDEEVEGRIEVICCRCWVSKIGQVADWVRAIIVGLFFSEWRNGCFPGALAPPTKEWANTA
jgi:hypothetical protein